MSAETAGKSKGGGKRTSIISPNVKHDVHPHNSNTPSQVKHLLESYREYINQTYGCLNFAAYSTVTGQAKEPGIKIHIEEIFQPFDFSLYPVVPGEPPTETRVLVGEPGDKVILAGPGHGKTTLLKFVLLTSFNSNIIPVYWEWKHLYPEVEKSSDWSSILLNYFSLHFAERFTVKDIKEFIRGQTFLLLLDGFDEVDCSKIFPKIDEMFKMHKRTNPGDRFVVASRISNYPPDYLDFFKKRGFNHFKINPLSEHHIFQYISKFISVQIPGDTLRSADKIKFLSKYIETQPGIKDLAAHPLLLSLFVLIYTVEGTLPDTKINLYERCIEILIYVWKKSDRDIRLFEDLSLDNATLYSLLSSIAFQYFDRFVKGKIKELNLLSRKDLRKIMEVAYGESVRQRKKDSQIQRVIAKLFEYFKNNTGVIVEMSPGNFGFSHLSLLEYLAARQIVTRYGDYEKNLDYILELLKNPRFRRFEEVVIFQVELLAKSTSKKRFIDILAKTLIRNFKKEKDENILFLLAKLLKDNQEFSIQDAKEILKLITISVARKPESTELHMLLNSIFMLSRESRDYFVELLGRSAREREIWENFSLRTGHRIGNKVFGIRGELNIIEKAVPKLPEGPEKSKIKEKLTAIEELITSLNLTLAEYKDYASEIEVNFQEYPIDEMIKDIVKKFRKTYSGRLREREEEKDAVKVSIRYFSKPGEFAAFTDKARIGQIIEELIENSIKHSGEKSLKIRISLEIQPKRFIVHYKDNGSGIPEDLKEKIFEPHFTTDSQGTGIGMGNVQKIVESLNGEIEETGEEGKGTHFQLDFAVSWR